MEKFTGEGVLKRKIGKETNKEVKLTKKERRKLKVEGKKKAAKE